MALAPVDVVGLAAGVLTTVAFVPQVVRIVRTRSAYDISWWLFGILAAGSALWLWYGIQLGALPLIVTNGITFVLAFMLLGMKLRARR